MIIEQISVFIENKKGHLANVTGILAQNDISIRAISLFDTPEFGILRIIPSKPELAKELLRENGYSVRISEVFAVDVEDTPGGIHKIVNLFEEKNIDIKYIYSFVLRKTGGPLILIKVDNPNEALEILKEANVSIIRKEEIYD